MNFYKFLITTSQIPRFKSKPIPEQSRANYNLTFIFYTLFSFRSEANLAQNVLALDSIDSLPVWRDWINASRHCQDKAMASGVPWTSEQFQKLKDPTVYTNVCTKHIFGDWAPRDREMTTDVTRSVISAKKKYTRKEYRESCVEVGF